MHSRLLRNAIWAVIEVLGSGLTLFFLYRIVVRHLGVEAVGIWSLVLATTSLGRFADLGTAAGLGRFVATAEARQHSDRALDYVETAIITNFLLYLGIALVLWAPVYYGLALAMTPGALERGRELLPYSLASFVLMSVTAATTGAIVGQHRSDQKSIISLLGLVVQFSVAVLFIPAYGLPALAWAQMAQYGTTIMASWLLFLKNHFGRWSLRLPVRWHRDAFAELIGFGMKLQAVSIAGMLFDPVVKFLMSSLGGLTALGYFEMAQRLIMQVRQLVVVPNQPLVPGFAHLMESEPEKIGPLYHKALAFSMLFGIPLIGGLAVASPAICYLWLGHVEPVFVVLMAILSFGWLINLIGTPGYILGIGIGRVRWNIYSAFLTTGGACVLGFIFGHIFGSYGVAVAASGMLAVGGAFTMIMNSRMIGIRLFPRAADFYAVWEQGLHVLRGGKKLRKETTGNV